MKLVKTSYPKNDVTVLLKDLSNCMQPLSTAEREIAQMHGVHYSEMLPKEEYPSAEYLSLYQSSLERTSDQIADYIRILAVMIMTQTKGTTPVLISLARAGTPVGILLKRYIKQYYLADCSHYSISIIRDKGIDINAMNFIYQEEVVTKGNTVENFVFIDGWTGKGAIHNQLIVAVQQLKDESLIWQALHDNLYVIADPGSITPFCATREDCLLPSSCLNSTVSGLFSRSILNDYINIANGDFHGAVYFHEFEDNDCSMSFIDAITAHFKAPSDIDITNNMPNYDSKSIISQIGKHYSIKNYLKIKPGIGETTRVLLRRLPYKVLINKSVDLSDPDIAHILALCQKKNVDIEHFSLGNYKVCGIIQEGNADI